MTPKIREDYYIKQKSKLMAQFDKVLGISRNILASKIEEKRIDVLFEEMKKQYEDLIPKIPYIGGRRNSFTPILVDCVLMLPIYRGLEKEGWSYVEIGEYSYKFYERVHEIRKRKLLESKQSPSERYFKDDYKNYLKSFAEELQKKIYPDNWVMEFVDGEGEPFNFGLKVTECGVVKVYKKMGAEKYAPFICLSDFVEGQMQGFGFKRTQTIGNGAPICDHRYIKGGMTPRSWPPNDLEEYKMDDNGNFKE